MVASNKSVREILSSALPIKNWFLPVGFARLYDIVNRALFDRSTVTWTGRDDQLILADTTVGC